MFNITFVMSNFDAQYRLKEVCRNLKEEFKNEFVFNFLESRQIENDKENLDEYKDIFNKSDFIFISLHSGITYFKTVNSLIDEFNGKKKFFIYSSVDGENELLLRKSSISKEEFGSIFKYYKIGGNNNFRNMVLYLASTYSSKNYNYSDAEKRVWEGIYYKGRKVEDEKEYIKKAKDSNKSVVGILFYSNYYFENNTRHIDKFIEEVENLGGVPLAVYTASAKDESVGYKGIQYVIDNYLMEENEPIVDVVINTMAHAQSILGNPGDGTTYVEESIFEKLKVPVLQAIGTYQSYESFKKSIKGIDSMALCGNVYDPEFDGQIITVATATNELIRDALGDRYAFFPIEERVNKVCRLALNFAKLRRKENKDKKVAIIFHNMPPRNDMIGCAFGLDTPQSVFNIVNELKSNNVKLDYDFENGDEIINNIIDCVSNDSKWLSEEKVKEKSIDLIDKDTYISWFSKLSYNVQEKMERDWGKAPGEFMVYDDKFPVPGILNGNVFIGLQPARGYEDKAEEVYHSTDIVPPHQYIAFYKWIRNVFKADVIIHVGTHGSLEWLPGKEIGLTDECYPDINIDDIPNLYPYIIDVPGEGAQAKRRSYATVLDHLIPSLMESGLYGEMENIDELIKQYYHAKNSDVGKVDGIKNELIELMIKNNFHDDLNIKEEELREDSFNSIEKLHGWIEEIKCSLIKDGLHIFGVAPKEKRYVNMIVALLNLPNGEVPSLIESVCIAKNINYNTLKDKPYEKNENDETNLMILDKLLDLSRRIIDDFHKENYSEDSITSIITKYFDKEKASDLDKVLKFVSKVVTKKLNDTTDELKNLIKGVNGEFVSSGGSGCPTRGRVDILPTGRNFYTIDPTSVPTKSAWEVGKRLGDELINRYLKDEGKYPESISIVVYSGETIKTTGDDIAEILYLMGIKPKWLEGSQKVVGIEKISLEELKRPRIDVTLRITGLFRDTFPNLIELIEDAVNLASSLPEDEKNNYLRKHVLNEIDELLSEGISLEVAKEEAGMRIFGCPPGTYGAGVDILINSKKWNDRNDLGDVYTLWGGHAYGKNIHGKKVKEVFERRLSSVEVTVKNESSMEIDMLDSDDFYNYHGGLVAAVSRASGNMPKSYSGNSSDPKRVKLKDINEETARIMRSRILNPKWFEGLKEHGYKGAQEVSAMVDIMFGWDATSSVIEDWMYDGVAREYLLNEERRDWIKEANPWAVYNMTERLLEANKRGMWNGDKDTLNELRKIYLNVEGDLEDYV
ncbi:cobaltochelatase subunit CobN [Clostridium ihumii]|uniref:cobaltochelatase subunit CobN n=1 Tax=Clostridium ihumii TaxID=1470356 RepID=UPI00058B2A62|nr:cobaltochelatase subunit CobN [Clostridium ihumii]